MINILLINFGEQFGGIEMHLKELIKNIDKDKFNITVLARKNSEFWRCINNIIEKDNRIKLYDVEIGKNNIINAFKYIKSIVKNDSIDVVHTHGILASYAYSLIRTRDVKFIVSTHGYCNYDRIDRGKAVISMFNYMEKKSLKKSDKCIAVSNDIKNYILKKGIEEEKVKVINHGILTNKFEEEIKIKDIEYEAEKSVFKVKSLGRLAKVKSYDVLIEAIRECLDNGVNLTCEIAGAGEEFDYLNLLIKELNLTKTCRLVGFVNNVEEFLQDANVYVQSSKIESFGISILEAMNNDVAVISSKVGGVSDIIQHKYNGLLFEEGNSHELAEQITYLANNEDIRIDLRRNAKLRLEDDFNIKNKVKEIEKLYAETVKM